MATRKSTDDQKQIVEVQELRVGTVTAAVIGTSPMIMNRFNFKAQCELLYPSQRKNIAERASTMKHDPLAEFRQSVYKNRNPKEPAAIHVPVGSFGKALASAAVDIPGATRAQMERLSWISSMQVNLFGIPKIFTAMTRNSDVRRTPDMRTRAMFLTWAAEIEVQFVASLIKPNSIINLLSAAGMIVGIGDWRPQKGGPYGKFRVVATDDRDYQHIIKTQGRVAQLKALDNPDYADEDTEALLIWYFTEVKRRQADTSTASVLKNRNGRRVTSKKVPLLPKTPVFTENSKGEFQGKA